MARPMFSFLIAATLVSPVIAQTEAPATAPMPAWVQEVTPEAGRQAGWEEYLAVYGDGTAIPPKYKQLIALAVAGQIPCQYCVYGHTSAARDAGATDEEIKEALAVAGQVRKWSTLLNGSGYDFEEFVAQMNGQ